ncbi:gliding motility-associated C-terminal domain-containing protein [Maribacter algarum]|uniref:Gliding motility-associated C-terminal domain-containing protein n=1 Tax=Maribacter algarum (ex Zhang et al. 2020) TaxID=2578118 RepID=A0A5S3PTX0_9FLAO|nr:gliding motility-associated C-terminal domain-containing protein [Maribacter algarum]TMM56140.1 gliding motility-associated C-terminal domain-containing protein [Maribacter algarum]
MKKLYFIVLGVTMFHGLKAQEALHNYGFLKIHDMGAVGFHHDLINDGTTDDNQGIAGFFSNESIIISGAFRPIFLDMEIMVNKDLYLEIGVGVTNNTNFILGDVVTPRNLLDINLDYINDSFYNGEDNLIKVDGYAALTSKQDFIFPIGVDQQLRPLKLTSTNTNNSAKSAYFRENPNNPTTFDISFNTENRTDILLAISNEEFWDIDAAIPSKVTLTWDSESNLSRFLDDLSNIRIVGWNTSLAIWEDLGNTDSSGDFETGEITSDTFLPNDYSIITFGGSLSLATADLDNYLLTPNGDGVNDYLHFDVVSLSPNNKLRIFNRWGRSVYEEDNYTNLFNGRANVKNIVNSSKKLPAGVYFYIINLYDINLKHQGYLYIEQE